MIEQLREEADYAYWRFRRRRIRQLVGGTVALLCGAGILILLIAGRLPQPWSPDDPPTQVDDKSLFVNFGMSRSPATRSTTARATLLADSAAPVENQQTSDAVLLATVDKDLLEQDSDSQFPADQIAVSARPLGGDQVQLTGTLTPSTPESVRSGFYEGSVTVRSGSNSIDVPIQAYLAPREGWHAVFAITLLLLGASLGLAVKWITEALSTLSAARWRFEALQRRLAGTKESLPFSAASAVDEIENRILRQDIADIDPLFTAFDNASLGQLRVFSTTIDSVRAEIDQQQRLHDALNQLADELGDDVDPDAELLDVDFLNALIRAERAQIDRMRMTEWPWKDPEPVIEKVRTLYQQVRSITLALQDYVRRQDARSRNVLELARRGELAEAQTLFDSPPEAETLFDSQPGEELPLETRGKTKKVPSRSKRVQPRIDHYPVDLYLPSRFRMVGGNVGWVQWMTRHPRGLAAAASVLVVVAAGFQLQYVGDSSFDGTLGQWLSLVIWAAVIELSGVSVLDVVGRLTTGRGSTVPASPT